MLESSGWFCDGALLFLPMETVRAQVRLAGHEVNSTSMWVVANLTCARTSPPSLRGESQDGLRSCWVVVSRSGVQKGVASRRQMWLLWPAAMPGIGC